MHKRVGGVHKPCHNMAYSIHKQLGQWGVLGGSDAIKSFVGGGAIMMAHIFWQVGGKKMRRGKKKFFGLKQTKKFRAKKSFFGVGDKKVCRLWGG